DCSRTFGTEVAHGRLATIPRTTARHADANDRHRDRRRSDCLVVAGRHSTLANTRRLDALARVRRALGRFTVLELAAPAPPLGSRRSGCRAHSVWFAGGIVLALGARLTAMLILAR